MSIAGEKQNLNLVQVLRGVASLLVVFYHATINSNDELNKSFLGNIFLSGFSGVDIFFVLSGFIITYTGLKNYTQPGKMQLFIRRRLVRIYPTYWIIISLFLLAQILLPAFYKTPFVLSFSNLLSTYSLWPGHVMVNGVSWTLSFELFFYLLFLLVFILPHKKWAFAVFAIYTALILILSATGLYKDFTPGLRFLFHPLNVEFFMGVLSALIISKIPARAGIWLIISGTLLLILTSALNNVEIKLLSSDFNRVIFFGIPAFLLIAGVVSYEINFKVKTHNLFLRLGEASYSLYLMHLPVIAAFVKLYPKLNIENAFVYNLLFLLVITIVCFISVLFFRIIERPIIAKLNAGFKKTGNLNVAGRPS